MVTNLYEAAIDVKVLHLSITTDGSKANLIVID